MAFSALPSFFLPPWADSLRPAQEEAIRHALDAYARGVKLVLIDAPTGTGKTLIAECVRQGLHARANYVCSTKTLQDQYARDFHNARVLKGRSNYPTLYAPREITCADCTKPQSDAEWCHWCRDDIEDCPYTRARESARYADVAILNTAYYLASQGFKARQANLTVLDEADTVEGELMRHVGIEITPRRAQEAGITPPRKVTVESAWREWVEDTRANVVRALRDLPMDDSDNPDVSVMRARERMMDVLWRLNELRDGLDAGTWLYTGTRDSDISFKPFQVNNIAGRFLWQHAPRWLLMSATLLSADEIVTSLGWDAPYEFIAVGSGFRAENRQIKICPVADMSRKVDEKDELRDGLLQVLRRHPDDRVLIHAVSYELAGWIAAELDRYRHVVTYTTGVGRQSALDDFLAHERCVLVAPSMDRGVDLPDDACRVVIVAKVPFPNLGDKQVAKRLYSYGGQQWYNVQTVRKIVQMTGRATRHEDDWSVSYILDKQFVKLYARSLNLFPRWWRDAVDTRDRLGV